MKRKASAEWKGSLKEGKGTISSDSGVLKNTQYSFSSRFEDGQGTNPEELIAAAHAGCFSMAFAHGLTQAGFKPKQVHTTASVKLTKTDDGFSIPQIDLVTEAKVPGIDEAKFKEQAETAKKNC